MRLDPRQLTVRAAARRSAASRAGGGRLRRYWPLGVAGAGALGWYAADSLRHRREGAFGYEIATELDVGSRGVHCAPPRRSPARRSRPATTPSC